MHCQCALQSSLMSQSYSSERRPKVSKLVWDRPVRMSQYGVVWITKYLHTSNANGSVHVHPPLQQLLTRYHSWCATVATHARLVTYTPEICFATASSLHQTCSDSLSRSTARLPST